MTAVNDMPKDKPENAGCAASAVDIFNIQHFSTHDGAGIRTTVFFKGCPLRCIWCHNPESARREPVLSFTSARCTACGDCVSVCGRGVHSITPEGEHNIDRARCIACGRCALRCPAGALELIGRRVTIDDIMREVEGDRAFYESSGGGMTVSGGEPFMQPQALIALFTAAKQRGIATACETCGYADEKYIRQAAPLCDMFLYDIKETDRELHIEFTGVSNDLILKNLALLDSLGAHVTLRAPLIPAKNTRAEHYIALGELCERYGCVAGIEIEPYHPLGIAKAENIGVTARYDRRDFMDRSEAADACKVIALHTSKPVRIV